MARQDVCPKCLGASLACIQSPLTTAPCQVRSLVVTAEVDEAAHRPKRKSLRWQVSKGKHITLFGGSLQANRRGTVNSRPTRFS